MVLGLIALVLVGAGIYFAYWYWFRGSDPQWCEKNNPDADYFPRSEMGIGTWMGQCQMNLCKKQWDAFEDQADEVGDPDTFKEATTTEIDSQCASLCASFNLVVDCMCQNCDKCHEVCGMSYLDRCRVSLKCGTSEYKVYPAETEDGSS